MCDFSSQISGFIPPNLDVQLRNMSINIYLAITAELWTQFWQRINCAIFSLYNSEFTSYSSLRIEEKVKMVTLTHSLTRTHTHSLTQTHTLSHTRTHERTLTHTLTHTHTHTHSHARTLTRTRARTLTHARMHARTLTRTHTLNI